MAGASWSTAWSIRPAVGAEIDAVHVEPWAGGARDTYLTIEPGRITGRRIRSW